MSSRLVPPLVLGRLMGGVPRKWVLLAILAVEALIPGRSDDGCRRCGGDFGRGGNEQPESKCGEAAWLVGSRVCGEADRVGRGRWREAAGPNAANRGLQRRLMVGNLPFRLDLAFVRFARCFFFPKPVRLERSFLMPAKNHMVRLLRKPAKGIVFFTILLAIWMVVQEVMMVANAYPPPTEARGFDANRKQRCLLHPWDEGVQQFLADVVPIADDSMRRAGFYHLFPATQ